MKKVRFIFKRDFRDSKRIKDYIDLSLDIISEDRGYKFIERYKTDDWFIFVYKINHERCMNIKRIQNELIGMFDNVNNSNFNQYFRIEGDCIVDNKKHIYSNETKINWWEFGHTNENIFISLILLPFRLIYYIIVFPIKIIIACILSILVILISILLLPVKIVLFIISFGYYNGFKNKFIGYLNKIWSDV